MKEDIKKEIVELLSDKRAREAVEIMEYLNYGREYDSLIMEVLGEMTDMYDLYLTKHNRYMNFLDSEAANELFKGYFQSKGEYSFVIVSNLSENIFIPRNFKNSAMDGDLVLASITKGRVNDENCEGKILKVLKRNNKTKVAEVVVEDQVYYGLLKTSKGCEKILLTGSLLDKLVPGDMITIEMLTEFKGKLPTGKVVKRIGHINDPGIDIISVLAEHDFEVEFPDEVLEELKHIPSEVLPSDLKGRKDLRSECIFTIDGDDTKDIDDAISVKVKENGNYELGVHIADVSYYVKENSPLDKEARKRGTSVYLADRVVSMLPHQLSNGICSLNPNVDRLSVSCIMEIDRKGNLLNYDVFPSVINSKKQMTYNCVNEILEKGTIPAGYEPFTDTLFLMKELATTIRQNKIKKGYIDFDVDEFKIIVDKDGNVLDIKKRYRGIGEKLIEDFMIMANESVASYIYNMSLPGIYRVHGDVNTDRLRKFLTILTNLGIIIKADLNHVNQRTIQRIIKEIKENEAFQILSTQMLSCMDKAKYQTNNIGHFALALRNYTHFTSPIRRYPDTTTHRLLREYIFKEELLEETIRHFENILDDICLTSSERERASVDCEREVGKMKMAEYMESHLGEVYEGMVSGITSYGMFVTLNDNLVEGMIPLDTMDDRYIYDKNTESLTGMKYHKRYTIGSKVKVSVLEASKEKRQIDFVMTEDVVDEKNKVKRR